MPLGKIAGWMGEGHRAEHRTAHLAATPVGGNLHDTWYSIQVIQAIEAMRESRSTRGGGADMGRAIGRASSRVCNGRGDMGASYMGACVTYL